MSEPVVLVLPNGQFAQNCYLLADPDRGEAVIVDPGEEWERFLAELERQGWTLNAMWLTHAHIDHVLGVGAIKEATGVPILLHPADRPLYQRLPEQGLWLGWRLEAPPAPDAELFHGQILELGSHRIEVRHTPGHTPGSVSLVGPGFVLSGDALFAGSIGRTDLPGGDYDTLIASVRRELLSLDDATRVLSGHGPETTIGVERRTNPFLADSR